MCQVGAVWRGKGPVFRGLCCSGSKEQDRWLSQWAEACVPELSVTCSFVPDAQENIMSFNYRIDYGSNCSKHLPNRSGCRVFPNLICPQLYSPPFSLLQWFIIYKGPTLGSIYEYLTRHQDVILFNVYFQFKIGGIGLKPNSDRMPPQLDDQSFQDPDVALVRKLRGRKDDGQQNTYVVTGLTLSAY